MPDINDLAKLLGMGGEALDVDDIDLDLDSNPTPSALERLEQEWDEDEDEDNYDDSPEVPFVTPDNLYNSPNSNECITFAYGHKVGLVYGNGSTAHYEMIKAKVRQAMSDGEPDGVIEELSDMVDVLNGGSYQDYLFGRLGQATQYLVNRYDESVKRVMAQYLESLQRIIDEEAQIIAFWNIDEGEYEDYYTPCMEALRSNGFIREPSYVSTPINGIASVGAAKQTAKTAEKTAIDPEKVRLQQQLHLMRGDEKKRAMEKLGLGFKGEPQHGMQAAMKRAGFIGPGQKWWAMHSEDSFTRKLNTILETI